jgi:hypothetical protein
VLQLLPVLKSPEPGLASQVASWAAAGEPAATSAGEANSAARSRLPATPPAAQ